MKSRSFSSTFVLSCLLAGPLGLNAADAFIDVDTSGFHPSTVMIEVNETVTWTAQDDEFHDITSDNNKWQPILLFQGAGDSATLQFTQPGSYPFHSTFDGTIGNVIVSAASGSNAPPSITITNPVNNAVFDAPATVTISADATDDRGIAVVQFYANSNPAGTVFAPPYTVTTNLPAGNYVLTAIAVDNDGAFTISTPVSIVVRHVVTYQNFSFTPSSLSIHPGETVLFTNRGGTHNVTGTGSEPYCGGGFSSIPSCVVTLNTPGTFPYQCGIHSFMTGSVTVLSSQTTPIVLGAPGITNNHFGFEVSGVSNGRTNLVQYSVGLTNWTSIATNVSDGNPFQFTDPDPLGAHRFYRVLELP